MLKYKFLKHKVVSHKYNVNSSLNTLRFRWLNNPYALSVRRVFPGHSSISTKRLA